MPEILVITTELPSNTSYLYLWIGFGIIALFTLIVLIILSTDLYQRVRSEQQKG